MGIIIYCRISSTKQEHNNSFETQLKKCKNYIQEKNLSNLPVNKVGNGMDKTITKTTKKPANKVSNNIYSEICSAYNRIPTKLNTLINKKNNTIVISNVNRFSRSDLNGRVMLLKCLENNNTLIFVDDNIIFNNINQIEKAMKLIEIAEYESSIISKRVKAIKRYSKWNNKYTGGGIKYGYDVYNGYLVENPKEMNIVNFIKLTKSTQSGGVKKIAIVNFIKNNSRIKKSGTINKIIDSLNLQILHTNKLRNLCKINKSKMRNLCKMNKSKSGNLHKAKKSNLCKNDKIYFTNRTLCHLFNQCNIKYRNNRWTPIKIKQIVKNHVDNCSDNCSNNYICNSELEERYIKKDKCVDILHIFKKFKKKYI